MLDICRSSTRQTCPQKCSRILCRTREHSFVWILMERIGRQSFHGSAHVESKNPSTSVLTMQKVPDLDENTLSAAASEPVPAAFQSISSLQVAQYKAHRYLRRAATPLAIALLSMQVSFHLQVLAQRQPTQPGKRQPVARTHRKRRNIDSRDLDRIALWYLANYGNASRPRTSPIASIGFSNAGNYGVEFLVG